jgi:hypothetical protein
VGTVSFFALLIESAGKVTVFTGAGGLTGGGVVVCADAMVMPLNISAVVVSSSFNLAFIIGGDGYVCRFISK